MRTRVSRASAVRLASDTSIAFVSDATCRSRASELVPLGFTSSPINSPSVTDVGLCKTSGASPVLKLTALLVLKLPALLDLKLLTSLPWIAFKIEFSLMLGLTGARRTPNDSCSPLSPSTTARFLLALS